ncbi:MAG: hypothetical protein Q9160_009251 [Pyrenula sp. 1 TL-2023]
MDQGADPNGNRDDLLLSVEDLSAFSDPTLPLHAVSTNGEAEIVQLLLENGADINATDSLGQTALHHAVKHSYHAVVALLISHGVDVNSKTDVSKDWLAVDRPSAWSAGCLTTLHIAARHDDAEMTSLLLTHQADHQVTSQAGYAALHIAMFTGTADVIDRLSSEPGAADLKTTDGRTATDIAFDIQKGPETFRALVRNGLLFDLEVAPGRSFLRLCTLLGKVDPMKLLIQSSINLDAVELSRYSTVLQFAVSRTVKKFLGFHRSLEAVSEELTEAERADNDHHAKAVKLTEWLINCFRHHCDFNVDTHVYGIPLETFPLTLREANQFSRALKIPYIWIDAICIIQDSIEDWADQRHRMASIYRHSVFTITAAGAIRPSECLFRGDVNDLEIDRRFSWALGADQEDSDYRSNVAVERISSLDGRAWVLQEQILFTRLVTLGGGDSTWRCGHLVASNTHNGASDSPNLTSPKRAVSSDGDGFFQGSAAEIFKGWQSLVENYTRRSMTKIQDKLIALAGVVNSEKKELEDDVELIRADVEKDMEKGAVSGQLTLRGHMARAFVSPAKEGEKDTRLWPSAAQQRKAKSRPKRLEKRFWRLGSCYAWYRDSPDGDGHETVWCLLVIRSPVTAETLKDSFVESHSPASTSHAGKEVHREARSLVCLCLVPAEGRTAGVYRRVGICELPDRDGIADEASKAPEYYFDFGERRTVEIK